MVTDNFDALELAKKVQRDSQTGALCQELLSQGQTLYGKNALYPEYLERITPDGIKTLGYWRDGKFVEAISLK